MVQVSTSKHWDSGLELSTDGKCPRIEEAEATKIIIPYDLWMLIMRLTREVDTEWLGYLKADRLETGDWLVTEIEIPEQEVTASSVKPKETIPAEGVIHSHVDMSAFFSSTDDDYLNSNHDFSIVVNRKGETEAVQRVKLPCGTLAVVKSKLEVEYPEPEESETFISEAKEKLKDEETPMLKQSNWYNEHYQQWNWGNQY